MRVAREIAAMRWRDLPLAVRAAWGAPRAIEHALPALLVMAPAASPGARDPRAPGAAADARRVHDALRATRRTLALLSRVPGSRWRTTCLYRSAAECLALRALGVSTRVVIGVNGSRDGDPPAAAMTGIRAHAWIAGVHDAGSGFTVLTGTALTRGDAPR